METRNKKLPADSVVPLGTVLAVLLSAHLGFAQEEAPPASALVVREANRPFRCAAQGTTDIEAGVNWGVANTNGASSFSALSQLGLRCFMLDGLAVGPVFRLGVVHFGGVHTTVFEAGPRVQYNLNLGNTASLYATGGLGINYLGRLCQGGSCSGSSLDFMLNFGGGVKVMVSPHYALGIGLDVPITFAHSTLVMVDALATSSYSF